MYELFKDTAAAIPVPAGLEERILTACRGVIHTPPVSKGNIVRLVPTAAALAACGAVLAVSLATTGHLPGFFTQPDPTFMSGGDVSDGTSSVVSQTTRSAALSTTQGQIGVQPTVTQKNDPSQTSPTAMGTKRTYFGIFEEMTVSQLTAHFGRRILPDWLPEDLTLAQPGHANGVYHRDDVYFEKNPEIIKKMVEDGLIRDAAITHDTNAFIYQGEGDRNLTVNMSTAPYPTLWLGDLSRFDETVTVSGVQTKLAYYDDSQYVQKESWCYSALTEADGVAFYVTAWNLTKEEFLQVLGSLL